MLHNLLDFVFFSKQKEVVLLKETSFVIGHFPVSVLVSEGLSLASVIGISISIWIR